MAEEANYIEFIKKHNFQNLSDIGIGQTINVCAKIVDFDFTTKKGGPRKNDITYLNLSLTDPTLEDEAILTIVTQGEREKFPPVLGNYIIILKNIRVGSYFKRFRLTGDEDTHFAVFSINSLKEVPPYDDGCILKYEDHLVVKAVAGWIRGNGYGLGPEQPTQVISNLLQSSVRNLNSLSSLRDILKKAKADTGKYLINASIVGYVPKNVLNWVKWWCSTCQRIDSSDVPLERCKVCRGKQEAIYQFNVLLQDQKGNRVLADVSSQDNKGLFSGISPTELLKNQVMYEKLSKATKGITQDLDLGIETFVSLGGLRDFKIIDTSFVVLNE